MSGGMAWVLPSDPSEGGILNRDFSRSCVHEIHQEDVFRIQNGTFEEWDILALVVIIVAPNFGIMAGSLGRRNGTGGPASGNIVFRQALRWVH